MKKLYFILTLCIVILGLPRSAFASHYRAGEITYSWTGGYNYDITIITYTNTCNTQADDPSVTVKFGDGSIPDGNAPRTNGNGVMIAPCFQRNEYKISHTYPGPGIYVISIEQPNRKAGILNMDDPLNTPFYIQTKLFINPGLGGHNNSPTLLYPPLDSACIGACFTHNPLAFDIDGDSLTFTIFNCLGQGGVPASGYYVPQGVTVGLNSGDLTWCVPQPNGNIYPQCYNFAMIIHEWRKGIDGVFHEVGYVERDLEVDVFNNCNDQPPVVTASDTCVQAGQVVNLGVSVTDPENTDLVTLTADGGPFYLTPPPVFTTPSQPQPIPASGNFTWNTTCDLVRKSPYQVQFKAQDNAQPVNLSGFKSVFITIVAPAPQNLTAADTCNTVTLNWDAETCSPANNPLTGYYIYRRTNCNPWSPSACETGVPAYTGYTLIGSSTLPTYADAGLVNGVNYSYRVTARYSDGAESYSSLPVCITLRQAIPILTNVDVISTGTNDVINVKWVKPVAGANGLDTLRHTGPYRYELFRALGYTGPFGPTPVFTFSSPAYAGLTVNSYMDNGLNTAADSFHYRIDFYASDTLMCSNQTASSVYLNASPSDNQVALSWNFSVPWTNYSYEVWRSVSAQPFVLIGTTTAKTYVDTGLVNGRTYCYKIKATGTYTDPSLPTPLINWSEEKCAAPIDLTPPCAPSLSITSDCDAGVNVLTWNNPNLSCADDVVAYNIFYTPTSDGDYQFLGTVSDASILTFIHDSLSSVAGCYVIAAVDSFNNQSVLSNRVCVDNCPVYELPNVFSPNGDGVNDYFVPFPYSYVKDIELHIFNRWGGEVFSTTDPDIHWDGTNAQSKTLCSDGVYFFTCKVNEIRLEGITPRVITGFVQILSGK
jgi:gliding motility-associated-like protein